MRRSSRCPRWSPQLSGPLTSGKGTTSWQGAGDKGRSVSRTGASAGTRSGTGDAPGSGAASRPRCSTVSESGSRCRPKPTPKLKAKLDEQRQGVRSSGTYTVRDCVEDWIGHGLDGRSDKTRQTYREAVAPDRSQTRSPAPCSAPQHTISWRGTWQPWPSGPRADGRTPVEGHDPRRGDQVRPGSRSRLDHRLLPDPLCYDWHPPVRSSGTSLGPRRP